MHEKKLRRKRSSAGQGLQEYALILALVAVAVIVIIGLVGQAVQRGYGIIGAVLGAKHEAAGVLEFNPSALPRCGRAPGQGTGFYTEIMTTIPMSELTISTDSGFILGLTPIAGGYKIYELLTPVGQDIEDLGLCPHGLVVQVSKAAGGTVALYPVEIKSW